MNQRLIAEIGRTQRLEILNSLKRTRGLSVNELVEKMNMSYMGIKQHCLTLQRDGYLDTWRRPQKMGRPEMVYRLTRRTHELFPTDSNQFTLELLTSVQKIYGLNAPEKLLYNVFEKKAADLTAKANGETVTERAKWLARVRDSEGCMALFSAPRCAERRLATRACTSARFTSRCSSRHVFPIAEISPFAVGEFRLIHGPCLGPFLPPSSRTCNR
ncbi:MAG: winged helix-turn-helix transcriptional regulator [Verrucomicrobia bacterium]|nr:MAG: winged helix-turn-helix transcriptional regulator [Verrucomicrobiota bacterium]